MGLLIFIALPLAVYLSLALVAKGRPAAIARIVALALVGVSYRLMPELAIAAFLALGGIAMAALAQTVRVLAAERMAPGLYFKLLGVPPMIAFLILTFSRGA